MPSIKKGESRSDYVARCVPYCMKNEGLDEKSAVGKCEGMYDQHKKTVKQNNNEFLEFSFEIKFEKISEYEIDGHKWTDVKAVAVIGDKFMKGIFVSYEKLKESLEEWNGTLHDINHMGTSYPDPSSPIGTRPNLEYIIGYNDSAEIDPVTKAVRVTVHINHEAPKYQAWKSYIDICKAKKSIPNVSMSIDGKIGLTQIKNLSYDWKSEGFTGDEKVVYFEKIVPRALTTAISGICNDKCGCGIGMEENENNECKECDECKCNKNESKPEDSKRKEYLVNRIKSLKENV